MFRKRYLTVGLRKEGENPGPAEKQSKIDIKMDELTLAFKKVALGAVLVVYGYVLLDTFRQVETEKAKHPPS